MTSWLAFLVTLSLIILVHEWGHFAVARRIGVKVERFSFGFGPRLVTWTHRGTEYALSLLPFGGYVKLAGESEETPGPMRSWEYRARSVGERALIVLAGPGINYLLAFLLFFVVFTVGAPTAMTKVGRVLEGYPAAEAGVQTGDRILEVGGRPVTSWEEMTRAIQGQTGPFPMVVERAGRRFTREVEPRVGERRSWLGGVRRTGMVGITPSDEVEIRRYPPGEALSKSAAQIGFLTRVTLLALWNILTGALSLKETITGPIGIFVITSSVAEQGIRSLLQLIAVLSTSIGLFNLLPIPVLDGGHLAFLAAERFRGRPVSIRAQEAMTRTGLVFLLLLLAVVTYNDLVKFEIGQRLRGLLGGR